MNWISIAWSMLAASSLTLGLLYLAIGLTLPPRGARLFFSLNAFAVAGFSTWELEFMRADSVARFETLLRWGNLSILLVIVSVVGFIWFFFKSGTKWLAVAGPVLFAIAIVFDYFPRGSLLTYREVTGFRSVGTFGGVTFNVAEGIPNPWNALTYIAVLLVLIFVADASLRLWRRGDRRRAAVVGGSVTLFILAAGVHSALVETGVVRTPYLISWAYLAMLVAMGYELTADVVAAARLSLQLVEGEQRMDLASAAAGLGIWTWDLEHDTIWTTKIARFLFGLPKEEESIGAERFRDTVHPDDRDMVRRALENSLESDRDLDTEYRVCLPDGEIRWLASRGRVERDSQGKPVLMRGAVLDTTARHRAEMERQQLQSQLAHVGRVSTMGQLASALAHELTQPLGAILRNAEAAELFLEQVPPDLDELRSILADIRKDDQRAGEVIERLRSLLKRRSIEPDILEIDDLLGSVAALLRGDAVARHVTLEFKVESGLPAAKGDRVHLQQVLLNLVLNAMDAVAGAAVGERRVAVEAVQDGRCDIEVTVCDSGTGIPADLIGTVFEPFVSTKANGMGMGLPISRTIVEAHGGRIWVENNETKGATFRFTIPCVKNEAAATS
jgi:two-component system, LuxR family, sensor kinase FixL